MIGQKGDSGVARPVLLSQASITQASFAAMQMISSMPLPLKSCAVRMKLGRCEVLQVPVKAPGRPKMITLRPAVTSERGTCSGPSGPRRLRVASGR